jgi:VanZ family protein
MGEMPAECHQSIARRCENPTNRHHAMTARIGPHLRSPKLWQILLAGYWLALFVATHLPPSIARVPGHGIDKLIHASVYALLAGLLATTWQCAAGQLTFRHLRWVWIALVLYAAFDELTQIPVGRTASWADWFADGLGALIGLALFAWWSAGRQKAAQ